MTNPRKLAVFSFSLILLLVNNLVWAQQLSTEERVEAIRDRVKQVQQRSIAVADINQLENLQRIYGYYTDKMLWEDVLGLFTEDATMEIGVSGEFVGQENIRSYLYSLSNEQQGPIEGEMYNHFQLQPVITLADDGLSAKGRWRAFMQLGTSGSGTGGQWGEGPYENEYVKEDGVWKISKLHWFATFIAPYEGGWENASREFVEAYSKGSGADQINNDDYNVRPPFHYQNPVTGE